MPKKRFGLQSWFLVTMVTVFVPVAAVLITAHESLLKYFDRL